MTQQILKQMKLFKPTVKFSEDENGNRKPYPPTVKVALRKKNDKFETVFYDQDKKEIKDVAIEDLIVKRMTVTALIECTGVWISSVGCGLSWKVKQLKVVSKPDGVGRGYGFIDDDEAPAARAPARSAAAPAPVPSMGAYDRAEITARLPSSISARDSSPSALSTANARGSSVATSLRIASTLASESSAPSCATSAGSRAAWAGDASANVKATATTSVAQADLSARESRSTVATCRR
jgi:hypothetical protein